ncbi:hypothetical protein HanXRQr2_Chr15g0680731 [Helianthus annuus]|uniref:Uncharacterized protein n=1 Tax=Helianthus annuus TaxID=4232 RepID=A0A9K3DXT9_HELAN|nr:hypothetical protein HanXRQr2_Chr15g0680731 [Helianthus annuus]
MLSQNKHLSMINNQLNNIHVQSFISNPKTCKSIRKNTNLNCPKNTNTNIYYTTKKLRNKKQTQNHGD